VASGGVVHGLLSFAREVAMLTVTLLLVLVAFGLTIAHALGKAPLWIAVLLMILVQLLSLAGLPLR
jgi:hypothetical protein